MQNDATASLRRVNYLYLHWSFLRIHYLVKAKKNKKQYNWITKKCFVDTCIGEFLKNNILSYQM